MARLFAFRANILTDSEGAQEFISGDITSNPLKIAERAVSACAQTYFSCSRPLLYLGFSEFDVPRLRANSLTVHLMRTLNHCANEMKMLHFHVVPVHICSPLV